MAASFEDILIAPQDAGVRLRQRLGLSEMEDLRLTFVSGYGDASGTFEHWKRGKHDSNVPIIAYSLQFFELAQRLNAQAQILGWVPFGTPIPTTERRFRFDEAVPPAWGGRWSYYRSVVVHARRQLRAIKAFDPHVVIAGHAPLIWRPISRGRKLVLTSHRVFWPMGEDQSGLKGQVFRPFIRYCAAGLDDAVCTSHECQRQIAAATDGRVQGGAEAEA